MSRGNFVDLRIVDNFYTRKIASIKELQPEQMDRIRDKRSSENKPKQVTAVIRMNLYY